jgi:outer membrane protein TolC
VTVEGGYTYYGDDLRLVAARFNGELGAFGSQILNADLVLRVPLYTGGRLVAELSAAQLLEAASGQRLARSKSDLIFNVSSLYYAQLAQIRLIDALAASRDALAAQLQRLPGAKRGVAATA